jgi:hypothetical protein
MKVKPKLKRHFLTMKPDKIQPADVSKTLYNPILLKLSINKEMRN